MFASLQRTARRAAEVLGPNLTSTLRPFYLAGLNFLSGGRGIPYQLNGTSCRIDPRLRDYFSPTYECEVAAVLEREVRAGDTCLDVGANVGVYVIQLGHLVGPTGLIIAFEPEPQSFRALENHIRINGLKDRVQTVRAAVSEKAGEAELFASPLNGMSRLAEANVLISRQAKPISVPVITLDDYCLHRGIEPDWLLIDIEGFEIAALKGARRLIAERGAALGIIVEMHAGEIWRSANTSREDAEALFQELNLQVVPLTGQRDPLDEQGIVRLIPRGQCWD